jgi:5-methylcytosine-specific restriction endonuclease McrA
MLCGSGDKLVVDHIKPRSKFPKLQLDPDNVQVLCNMCNIGKSDEDMSDFRGVNLSLQIADALKSEKI